MEGSVFFLIGVVIIVALVTFFIERTQSHADKRALEARARSEEEREKSSFLFQLEKDFEKTFSIELDTINESATRDEIVRIVNLLAHRTAVACMNQDKAGRGEKTDMSAWHESANGHTWTVSWDIEAKDLKREWSRTRKIALLAVPELADRLPHFSEFEPLKSYNAEHLQKKVEKRAARK